MDLTTVSPDRQIRATREEPVIDTSHKTALLKITKRVFSEQPLKKRNRKLGTDIATSEPDTEADGAATEAAFQMLTGAAAKAVMELMQEPLSRFRNSRRSR